MKCPHPQNCPGDNEMAVFLDGRATGSERRRFLAHLAGCPPCREALAAAVVAMPDQARPAAEGRRLPPWFRAWPIAAALGALAVLSLYFLLSRAEGPIPGHPETAAGAVVREAKRPSASPARPGAPAPAEIPETLAEAQAPPPPAEAGPAVPWAEDPAQGSAVRGLFPPPAGAEATFVLQVVDGAGRPLPGCAVCLFRPGKSSTPDGVRREDLLALGVTGPDGTWRAQLPDEAFSAVRFRVRAVRKGYLTHEADTVFEIATDGCRQARLVLLPAPGPGAGAR